ncbi:MAG TPA: D-amino acid aminotransferase [Longimicrobiales bacterium]|nr:D-amino acid aminotransferase [Longimicrobiales bacterium]
MIVYLNGEFVPHSAAHVSVDDRGFLFADGVYEVARVYNGHIFLLEPHLDRLRHGLRELRIRADAVEQIPPIADRLLTENRLQTGDATLYIQITRGAAPRAHAFPAPEIEPTIYIATRPFKAHPDAYWRDGVPAITVPDTRWSRCDIKSIALLPNVLANQQAKEAGAFEALFVRDHAIIEGSHSNLFGVLDGELITYAPSGYILTGITRLLVLEKARALGIGTREAPIPLERLYECSELFLSGTTTEIMPIVRVDDRAIGTGQPGPITCQLRDQYRSWVEEDQQAVSASHGAGSALRAS